MTSQSSGGSGSGLPGVTSDGLTPGGLNVAGALRAGDPNAASVPSFLTLNGATTLQESPGNVADGDALLSVMQTQALTADHFGASLYLERHGALNGYDYRQPAVLIYDFTPSTQPLVQVTKRGVTQFQVDGDGVQVHGKFKTGASVAHVLGAFSGNAVPIYDEAGTLLGYMPLYA